MASEAVCAAQQQNKEEAKPKNAPTNGRNRKALQDIGNFASKQAVQASKKVETKLAGTRDAVSKTVDKLTAENVIVITSGEDHNDKSKVTSRKTAREEMKTFSAILSARSKAANGLTKEPIVDIDKADANNELAVVEYADDIYKFFKLTEDERQAPDYMDSQPDINAKMRSILVDWLIEVHRKFELMPETLYLTVNIVDRFLSMKNVPRRELQLVGISSMLIASKYEEIWAPEVSDFVCISDNTYTREQVLVMEKAILGQLEWYLTLPTPYAFLLRYVKASAAPCDKEIQDVVFFLAELSMMHYSTSVLCKPSLVAAAAVYAARSTMNISPVWTETLKHHTGYSENEILNCAKLLVKFHATAPESKLKAAYKKYSCPDNGAVALLSPAKNLLASS